jgi:hypothetical protein
MILRQCRRINGWRWSINALTLNWPDMHNF